MKLFAIPKITRNRCLDSYLKNKIKELQFKIKENDLKAELILEFDDLSNVDNYVEANENLQTIPNRFDLMKRQDRKL